jgi:hypothetical protein
LKKTICILFLGVYLISSTELRQLLKFPLLIQHYAEHKAENQSLTLLQFLAMHYNDEDIIDLDYSKDQQLPFKSQDGYTGSALSVFEPTAVYTLIPKASFDITRIHFIANDDFTHSVFLSSIWQPPKSASIIA